MDSVSLRTLIVTVVAGIVVGSGFGLAFNASGDDAAAGLTAPNHTVGVEGRATGSTDECRRDMSDWVARVAATSGSDAAYNDVLQRLALTFGAESAEWRLIYELSGEFVTRAVKVGREQAAAHVRDEIQLFCADRRGVDR